MLQRIFQKKSKDIQGWSYWGELGEIEVGISSGTIASENYTLSDPLHYHKKGIIFILGLEGEGNIEVDGIKLTLKKDEVLRISPQEKYRHIQTKGSSFSWITFCTVKDPTDKVTLE